MPIRCTSFTTIGSGGYSWEIGTTALVDIRLMSRLVLPTGASGMREDRLGAIYDFIRGGLRSISVIFEGVGSIVVLGLPGRGPTLPIAAF